jgi:hypothetical protein
MATNDSDSDAEQHMEPCNDAYFKLIGVLGDWCFSSTIRVVKLDTVGPGDERRRKPGWCPMKVFRGRAGTALGNGLGANVFTTTLLVPWKTNAFPKDPACDLPVGWQSDDYQR